MVSEYQGAATGYGDFVPYGEGTGQIFFSEGGPGGSFAAAANVEGYGGEATLRTAGLWDLDLAEVDGIVTNRSLGHIHARWLTGSAALTGFALGSLLLSIYSNYTYQAPIVPDWLVTFFASSVFMGGVVTSGVALDIARNGRAIR